MIPSPKILLFQEYFSPGYLAGGMQTAAKHLLSQPNEWNIRIVTSNFDLNSPFCYPDICPNQWINRPFGLRFFPVWYAEKGIIRWHHYIHFYSFKPDRVYLQGIYGFFFFLMPLVWAKFVRIPVIICPHGMLDQGSLKQKFLKKYIYLFLFKLFCWHKNIRWQATSTHEERQIRRIFGENANIFRTKFPVPLESIVLKKRFKKKGVLHLFYYGRISPKKNLHFILENLLHTDSGITLSIVGPVEDQQYWEKKCTPLLRILGDRINFHGPVASLDDYLRLAQGHFMILLSDAENFSFAIFECLSKGVPVITTQHTPWENLSRYHGGVMLSDQSDVPGLFYELSQMSHSAYRRYCQGALTCARAYMEKSRIGLQDYNQLFS
jgi:glycosyltransferase involved in cell wall biosynthesis